MEDFFKVLNQIPKISAQLDELIKLQKDGTIEKKWLNVEETAYYLGYSKDKIYKLLQDEWTEGIHYHKPTGRVIVDKDEIDRWVTTGTQVSVNQIIENIFINKKLL